MSSYQKQANKQKDNYLSLSLKELEVFFIYLAKYLSYFYILIED